MAVAEVDPTQLEDRDRLWIVLLAPVLFEFFFEFYDDGGEVVADVVRAAHHEHPPDDDAGIIKASIAGRTPNELSRRAEATAPPAPPMKKI